MMITIPPTSKDPHFNSIRNVLSRTHAPDFAMTIEDALKFRADPTHPDHQVGIVLTSTFPWLPLIVVFFATRHFIIIYRPFIARSFADKLTGVNATMILVDNIRPSHSPTTARPEFRHSHRPGYRTQLEEIPSLAKTSLIVACIPLAILFFVFGMMLISPYSDVVLNLPASGTRAGMGELK